MPFMFGGMTSRLWQLRYFAGTTMLLLLSYFLVPVRRSYDPNSTSVVFLHLLTFAAHFGAQCWVTFIAGLAMFYSIPRIMFGQVQKRLVPMYFATTLVLSSVTLVTYVMRHPYDTLSTLERKQLINRLTGYFATRLYFVLIVSKGSHFQYVFIFNSSMVTLFTNLAIILTICVISTFVNSFFLIPEIVDSMEKLFECEQASGAAYVIGYVDKTEMKKNPAYFYNYVQFRMYHSFSGILNLITLLCNTVYLYHLACLCVTLNLNKSTCI